MSSKIDENDTGDMAPSFGSFRNKPCFEIDSSDEYNSFCKGVKTFHRWNKHTKSESIRQWANENKGKEFYVTHNNSYTLIKRKK